MAVQHKTTPASNGNGGSGNSNTLSILALIAALAALAAQFIGPISTSELVPQQLKSLVARGLAGPNSAAAPPIVAAPAVPTEAKPYVRVFSYDPFIAHIVDLVTPDERAYLKQLALPLLTKSTVVVDGKSVEHEARTSSTAFLPENDTVVQTITRRVQDFQGYMEYDRIDLQVTQYQEGQQYQAHFDWYEPGELPTNRFSTFFATLESSCDDCGTNFPEIHVDWSKRDNAWCQFLDCSKDTLTSRNIPGGAMYWRNLDDNFYGRPETLHAGLPAAGGYKLGLNIWTEIRMPEGYGKPALHEPPQEEQGVPYEQPQEETTQTAEV